MAVQGLVDLDQSTCVKAGLDQGVVSLIHVLSALYSTTTSLLRFACCLSFVLPFHVYRPSHLLRDPQSSAVMHSPLPDASALEAGILEDERPSRLSRVQDNVRHLLRASVVESLRGSSLTPPDSPVNVHVTDPLATPPQVHFDAARQPDVLLSPVSSTTAESEHDALLGGHGRPSPGARATLFPASTRYRDAIAEMAHQSCVFNSRAMAALGKTKVADSGSTPSPQHKTRSRGQGAWKRPKHRGGTKSRKRNQSIEVQCAICVLSSLLLASVVATCEYPVPFITALGLT